MKRPIFHITINGVHVGTKNAWNSACRAMPGFVVQAIPSGSAREVSKTTERLDPWHFKSGVFQWEGSDGAKYEVKIELQEPQL